MNQADFKALSRIQATAIDSLLAIPQLCLSTSESLVALNVSAARDALADSATLVRVLAGVASAPGLREISCDLSGPMLDKVLAYGCTLLDILGQTQDDLARLMIDACRVPDLPSLQLPIASPWPAILAGLATTSPPTEAHGDGAHPLVARRSA